MDNTKHKLCVALITMTSLFASFTVLATPVVDSKTQNKSPKNVGVSADQFKMNFNKLAQQLGAPTIKKIQLVNDGSGKTFSIQMPNHLAMIGNTDRNGILTRLSVGLDVAEVSPNELRDHSMMLGGFAVTAIKALDQNKVDQKRDDAVQDVYESLFVDKKTFTSRNTKYKIYKNFKLVAFSDPKMGVIMIGAEAK